MRVLRRVLIVLLGAVLVVGVAAGVVAYRAVHRPMPDYDATVELPGLHADVDVYRDPYGIPQVYASDAVDLFQAQGYVHAQDRFFEMDFRRHVTSGRLSELLGKDTVDTDVFLRTLNWHGVAEQEVALLSPSSRRYLQAYADGVNAYLASRSAGQIALQYTVLGLSGLKDYRPEPWTPADSLAWLKAMAWDLRANMQEEIDRALLSAVLPKDRVEQLYPLYDTSRQQPIVADQDLPKPAPASAPAAPPSDPKAARALQRAKQAIDTVPALLGQGSGIGSNSWVVAGSLTRTGKPLLANDPHLAPALPSVWYQMGLHCRAVTPDCPFEVSGFTFSGLPGVVIGHTDKVAWGFTNFGADVTDLYLEQMSGDSARVGDRYEPVSTRREVVKVLGEHDRMIVVRSTRHGPIVSDADDKLRDVGRSAPVIDGSPPRGNGYAVALRWTALEPGRTGDAIFAIDQARSWEQFRAAAALFEVPSQNMVYADTDGNIGYQAPGKIPVRRSGDGRYPVPGWVEDYEWTGYVPFDELPRVFNPAQGYVVTANNAAVSRAYPYRLTDDWSYGYRSERIRTRLDEATKDGRKLDVATMSAIQLDTYNGNAATLVPYLLKIDTLHGWYAGGQQLLRGWDFTQPADSAPAAYFNAVWKNLLELTFDDDLPKDVRADGGDRWFEVVRALLDKPDDPFWDDTRTKGTRENRDAILEKAMRQARDELTMRLAKDPHDWSWGRLHTLQIKDQTLGQSGIGLVEKIFNRGPYELGGGSAVVDATGWDASKGYQVDWVPSMRMVVDVSDFDASRWVNLTGASGHPYSAHYDDQSTLWASGRTTPMRWSSQTIQREAKHHLRFTPDAGGLGSATRS